MQFKARAMRSQGLTDSIINNELTQQGYPEEHVSEAMSALDDLPVPTPEGDLSLPQEPAYPGRSPELARSLMPQPSADNSIYERIEELTENLIDEKWDELIAEVKKIVEWKQKVEEKQTSMLADLRKLKEDFAILHQGVLGKLGDYDSRMRDVGAELQAVSKVFKDVVPEFVENVKELKYLSEKRKK